MDAVVVVAVVENWAVADLTGSVAAAVVVAVVVVVVVADVVVVGGDDRTFFVGPTRFRFHRLMLTSPL